MDSANAANATTPAVCLAHPNCRVHCKAVRSTNGAVMAQGPQNVIQVILGGLPAQQNYARMLAIGAGMADNELAAVTNHMRQQWGNQAPPPATPKLAAELRATVVTLMTVAGDRAAPSANLETKTPLPGADAFGKQLRRWSHFIGE